MKARILIFIFVIFLFSIKGNAQAGYTMQPGETIKLDEKGIITPETLQNQTSKLNTGGQTNSSNINKNSMYNDDGTYKIPGYTPTGNAELDEELYKKAKFLLYTNNHDEYVRIFEKQEVNTMKIIISYEEFKTFPDNKKQHILEHPERYFVESLNEIKECK